MQFAIRQIGVVLAIGFLASCGGGGNRPELATTPIPDDRMAMGVSDTPVTLGAPFTVGPTSYKPEDIGTYDEVGYASYYGPEMAGRSTANGEAFISSGISAAHKTLPMPTYVEVTALDTGRTILVRVNDRGPFANDRLIDLSEGAAQQLGITGQGIAGVRVRKVSPPEQERAVLRQGMQAAERIETPESLLKVLRDKLAKLPRPSGATSVPRITNSPSTPTNTGPVATGDDRFIREGAGSPAPRSTTSKANAPKAAAPRVVTPKPAATGVGYVVQVSSFSSRARADALARKLGAKVSVSADGKLFRVRFGPFATEAEAQRSLASAKAKGYPQARLLRE